VLLPIHAKLAKALADIVSPLNTCSNRSFYGRAGKEWPSVGAQRLWRLVLAAPLLFLFLSEAPAHTLPISYLYLVPDADYLHLELILNPFELSFFSELDQNKDGQLEPSELEAQKDGITRHLVEAIQLKVNGKLIPAEVSGLIPDVDCHHLALRAHYRVDARRATLTLESTLPGITSGSHLTQVTCFGAGHRQLAQVGVQSPKATFEGPERAAVSARSTRQQVSLLGPLLIPGMSILAFSLWMNRKQLRVKRVCPQRL
jgi:hypothetical protein